MKPPVVDAQEAGRAIFLDRRWNLETSADHVADLVAAVAREGGGAPRRWVVSDPTPSDEEAAARSGLEHVRDVLQLRRPLPVEPEITGANPPVDVRGFRPGTVDEEAWIDGNNRAFAGHPDQAGFTLDRLHRLMAEPWFDPEGFLLHYEDAQRLAAFCWTKIHRDADPRLGEIFVIGVDPAFAGRGLGPSITLSGLDWLAGRGLRVGMLYVDADNTSARRMYGNLGFTHHHTDVVYEATG